MKKKEQVLSFVVARPVRKRSPVSSVADRFLPYFPEVKKKIILADMSTSPSKFFESVIFSALLTSIIFLIATAVLFSMFNYSFLYLIPLILIYPVVLFYYFMLYLDVGIIKRKRSLEQELVFVIRYIIIALRSGMPLFDTLVGVSVGYGSISKEFGKIVERVTLGVPLSQALRESSQNTPSRDFSRVIMQIANSLSSGANIADSLEAVLEQISRDQIVQLKAYGQKLTPLVMFFMIFGIILPSLGVAFAVILFSFLSGGLFGITTYFLVFVFIFILLVQFLFLAMVEGSRPQYDI